MKPLSVSFQTFRFAEQEVPRSSLIARPGTLAKETENHLPAEAAQRRSHHYPVATMKKRRKKASQPKPTQEQVDRLVTAEADEDSAWQKALVVRRSKSTSLTIPAELAARAAFLARLHRESRVDKYVEPIVRERVEIEESAFTAARRLSCREDGPTELAADGGRRDPGRRR